MKKLNHSRRTFTAEFKRDSVSVARKVGFAQAAADLGVTESNLRNWAKVIDTCGSEAFKPASERTDLEAENQRLRKQLRHVEMERDFLKKATAFFAKENG